MNEIISMLVMFVPLFIVMGIANLAERQREHGEHYSGFAITGYLLMGLLYMAGVVGGILIQGAGMLMQQQPNILEDLPFQPDSFAVLGAGIWIPSLFGIILLLPPVRRLFARFTKIDAASPVHAIALSLTMIIVVYLMFNIGIGLANLAEMLEAQAAAGVETNTVVALWAQQIFTAIFAMIGVGWITRRGLGATLERLGIVVPTVGQVILGVVLGLVMVPVIIGVDALATQYNWGADQGSQELTEQLLGQLFTTPFGIFTVGAAAALGEETIFRGALQPRLGILLTSLLFALIHGNYGLTIATLIVFLMGMVLGFLRRRYNTSTSMAMHATYNITLALLTALGV